MAGIESDPVNKLLEGLPVTRSFVNFEDSNARQDLRAKIEALGGTETLRAATWACLITGQVCGAIEFNDDVDIQDAQLSMFELFILMGYEIGNSQTVKALWFERISDVVHQMEAVPLIVFHNKPEVIPTRMDFYLGLLVVGVMLKEKFKDPLETYRKAFGE
ncbi:MAG: hypothetical protein Q7S79_00575 [bacterium]|nr:hypothetical protein [bacterium]